MYPLPRRFTRLKLCCILVMVLIAVQLGIPLLKTLTQSEESDPRVLESSYKEARYGWLRRSRNARDYVFPDRRSTLIGPRIACEASDRLLLVVTSSVPNREERNAVRDTWGTTNPHVRMIFLLGHNGDPSDIPVGIRRELEQFDDIVVEDFIDTYYNLTLKSIFMLKWALENCPTATYVMKTDDDMLINMNGIMHSLEVWSNGESPFVIGNVLKGVAPYRNPLSKWYLPAWLYEGDHLPDFVAGPGYIVSHAALEQLYEGVLDTPMINLEDVYVTGIVAKEKLKIPLIHMSRIRNNRPLMSKDPCFYHHLLTVHDVSPEELKELWAELQILDGRTCDTMYIKLLSKIVDRGEFFIIPNAMW